MDPNTSGYRRLALGIVVTIWAIAPGGSARASAALDLLWRDNGQSALTVAVSSSTVVILDMILTTDDYIQEYSYSIDYDETGMAVAAFSHNAMPGDPYFGLAIPANLVDDGSAVGPFFGGSKPTFNLGIGLHSGEVFLVGTISFHVLGGAGTYELSPQWDFLQTFETRDVFPVSAATLHVTPQPGTSLLLALGLAGLGWRRRSINGPAPGRQHRGGSGTGRGPRR